MNAPLDSRHAALLKTFGEMALAKAAHRFTPDAEGLKAVFRRTPAYAEFDEASNLLVVTRRGLILALLEEGRQGSSAMPNGNAAMWLARWNDTQLDAALLISAGYSQSADALERAVEHKVGVAFHPEVETVMEEALQFARRVRNKSARARGFALRHLVALCLRPVARGGLLGRVGMDLNRPLGEANLQRCRDAFVPWVTSSLPSGETQALWASAFAEEMRLPTPEPAPATPPPEPGPPLVTTFAPDRPASDPDGPDPMRINKDVTAFARLIAHKDTATPLAIGVFGAWGSGKSTFMERLEASIDQLAAAGREGAVDDGFVASVVHVRFNAWSFADANLWASLGAEFFDQLRVGGHSKKGKDLHAGLVERVTTHVHDLKSTAEETRAVANAGERELATAQQQRDAAVKTARKEGGGQLTQGLLDGMARAHEAFKGELGHEADDVAGLIATAQAVQTAAGRRDLALRLFKDGGWRAYAPGALFALGLVLALAAGLLLRHDVVKAGVAAVLAALGPGAVGLLAAFGSGLKVAKRLATETAGFARQLKEADDAKLEKVLKAELALKDAADEAEARRKAAERATRALTRYIDPQGTSNPPRLLRYVLEDDPATRALEKEIGLISRTRRLFEAVDEILRDDREKRAKGGEVDRDTPERIVIYIDDLDRCTQEQVQSVLQAVHLLLAFESFVVVVGVDQVRVAEALARQFDDDDYARNDSQEEIDRRMDRAVLYLEKIFQLAFRLQPLSPAGDDGGAYSRFVDDLIGPTAEAAAAAEAAKAKADAARAAAETAAAAAKAEAAKTPPSWPAPPPPETPLQTIARQLGAPPPPPTPSPPEPKPAVTARQALETLMIGDTEAQFLRSVAIGSVAGSTPRNVKRMLNVYRLARVRLAEDGFDLTGKGGGRPLYPLLALFAALDTGREPKVAKKAFDALRTDKDPPLADIVRLALPDDATMITDAVVAAYGDMPTAADCRPIADLVRRYSFNALDD